MKNTIITNKSINIKCYIAFAKFIESKNNVQLLYDLLDIERSIVKGRTTDKTLWFRFTKDDTLVTTIRDIEEDLDNSYSNNYKHLIESIKIALNDVSLIVNFS